MPVQPLPNDVPNFLFLFPDQWRWDFLGCETSPYGKMPVRTPNIDALAARGVRFTQCRTNSPVCAPARAALSQGLRYHRCGVESNGQDTPYDAVTYYALLREAGYRTLTCGKNDLHKKTFWKGRDGWTHLMGKYGFSDAIASSGKMDAARWGQVEEGGPHCAYTSYLHSHGLFGAYREASNRNDLAPAPFDREHYTDDFCGRMAIELLDRTPANEPWALWVNFPGPHDPFDPPAELQRRYDGVDFPDRVGSEPVMSKTRQDVAQARRNYAACCEGLDEWVGWIIDKVEQRGELDNTVVIFSSDHGEMLGDHGKYTKGVPYEPSVHVPLIVAGPGIARGKVSHALVELIDLAATHLDLAGLSCPDYYDSKSLKPILCNQADDKTHRDVTVSSLGRWRMVFDGRYKLVETLAKPEGDQPMSRDGEPALYDLQIDPGETADLSMKHPEIASRLAAVLKQHVGDNFKPELGQSPARRVRY
ncbi:MAG: sulfatase-like hydrolase/transferase [Phycisphaera sp.]|nr:sulfatase-like hydrolase/transferase [Phycisphaera sp.]